MTADAMGADPHPRPEDGEVPSGDRVASRPPGAWELPEDDWDQDAYAERFLADVEDGIIAIPPERSGGFPLSGGLEVSALVPGSACTPDGLKGLDAHGFTGGWAADEMPAGPLLAILAEQAVSDPGLFRPAPVCEPRPHEEAARAASVAVGEGRLAGIPGVPGTIGARGLTGNELLGAISAAVRVSNRAEWMRLALAGELIRRRLAEAEILGEERATSGRRLPGIMDTPASVAEELRFQQILGPQDADLQYGMAVSVPARMPALNARAADGMLSHKQMAAVYRATMELSDEDARLIDIALAPDAHEWTAGQLRRRARYLAMKLDPEAADRRKKKGRKEARVESWQEDSGNAALAGRELDPEVVLAASAYYDSLAQLLRRAGVPGTLTELRALAFADRNTGKDPLDRIKGYRQATADDNDAGDNDAGDNDAGDNDAGDNDAGDGENTGDPEEIGDADRAKAGDDGNPEDCFTGEGIEGDGGGKKAGNGSSVEGTGPAANGETAANGAAQGRGDDENGTSAEDDSREPEDEAADDGDALRSKLRDDGYREPLAWLDDDDEDAGRDGKGRDDDGGLGEGGDAGSGLSSLSRQGGPGVVGGPRPSGQSRLGNGGPQEEEQSPFRAMIHLFVSVGTLLGQSGAPGMDSRNGLHGPGATRDLVRAASRHPDTRWRVIFTGPDGTAIGHTRPPGQHAWPCPPSTGPSPGTGPPGSPEALLRWLGVTSCTPIARGGCDHASREGGYVPSEGLKDLIRARNATCVAPGCGAKAVHCDVDHTIPWPAGPTDQCNLGPTCRRHHKLKQSRGWTLEQPEPGHFTWTAPSGRAYWAGPTVYDA